MTINSVIEESDRILVRLYILNDEGQWEDKMTGNLFIGGLRDQNDDSINQKIALYDENDGQTPVYDFDISTHIDYVKQQETLIVWEENERELALSFQNSTECQTAFEMIQNSQRVVQEGLSSSNEDSGNLGINPEFNDARNIEIADFPDFNLENLSEIAAIFVGCTNFPAKRDQLSSIVEKKGAINKLIEIFKTCESLEDKDGCENVYTIIKTILTFTRFPIYESMLNDDNLIYIIGIMEYNPDINPSIPHRKIVDSAKFLEIIPFHNSATRDLIVHTHRLQYLQDIVMPTPAIFEERGSLLTSFVYFRKNEIMEMIFEDEDFLPRLFESLINDDTEEELREKMVKLFVELCGFSRSLQNGQKEIFISKILKYDVILVIDKLKNTSQSLIETSIIEILSRIVETHPDVVRQGLLACQERKTGLIKFICDQFLLHPDSNNSLIAIQIMKIILDFNNTNAKEEPPKNFINIFLNMFYADCIGYIMAPMYEYTRKNTLIETSLAKALVIEHVLDILCICITFHTFHIKSYVFKSDIIKNVTVLLNSKHAFLSHGAVRVIRRSLSCQNDFYNRYLSKEGILDLLVESLKTQHMRYNIVNSAIIEAFEYIRVCGNRMLILNLVENHKKFFDSITNVGVFKKLNSLGEQFLNEVDLQKNITLKPILNGSGDFGNSRENSWFEEDEEGGDEVTFANDYIKTSPNKEYLSEEAISSTFIQDGSNPAFPPLKPKFVPDDNSVTLRPLIITKVPKIKLSLKRKAATLVSDENKNSSISNEPTKLVDYPDDEESTEALPPCDDYTIDDGNSSSLEVPPKKSNLVDTV